MKHIRTFESFRNKKEDKINEELLGGLFKSLKNKMSVGFSKMFGSAKEADKIIEEYKNKLIEAGAKKREMLKQRALYVKSVAEGGEKDINKENEMSKNFKVAEDNYTKQIEKLKEIYDIKIKEVVSGEKNPKIQNYIRLKKLELEKDLLEEEIKAIFNETGLKEEQLKDSPEFQDMIKNIEAKIKTNEENTAKQKAELEKSQEKNLGFDIKKAIEMSKEDKVYLWEESPFAKREFKNDEEITYFSQSNSKNNPNYEGTKGKVIEDMGEKIKVETESGGPWEINKKAIISASSDKEAQSKQPETVEGEEAGV
jgi:hypothetical protein